MLSNKVIKKTIAVFLIFTLTFSNFAFVTKSYATSFFDSVFSSSSDTDNVKFDAYLTAEEEKSTSAISVACENSVNLSLNLDVQKAGYLKNAQISITGKEENSKLNFKILEEIEESENIKSFLNNVITLKQINSPSDIKIDLPLTYEQEEFITLDKLDKEFKAVLTGTYVNDKAEEMEINKEVELSLAWVDKRDIQIESEVTKYIPYSVDDVDGVILQTSVRVSSISEKSGAVKSTNLEIQTPKIEDAELSKVSVVAKSTMGTDGRTADEVEFSEDNWNYEDGLLTINKEAVTTLIENEIVNEDNTLMEETGEAVEKYSSTSGIDEYIITYTFENVSKEELELTSNIKANVITFGKEDIENKAEQEFKYEVSEKLGDIVTYEVQNDTENISKGYTYLNYNNEDHKYEIEYSSKDIVNITYKDIVEDIYVVDEANYYVDKESNKLDSDDVYYKSVSVSKDNFDTILGEDGEIEIQEMDGSVLAKFTSETEADENGNLVYTFEPYEVSNIILKTTNPIEEGNLIFAKVRVQNYTSYDKETFKSFDILRRESKAEVKYTYLDSLADAGKSGAETVLEDTITKADIELSTTSFSTLTPTDVELKIKLNNDKIISDVYGDSKFVITMPEGIDDFEINDYNIAYGEGLELTSVDAELNDEGRIVITIIVEGLQQELSSGIITDGTNIVIPTTITLNKFLPKMEKEIEFIYENSEATNYFEEGVGSKKVEYTAPTGVVSVNTIRYDENEITSISEGINKSIIDTYSEAITANMEVLVMNNNTNAVSNVSILGRVPFVGNKDVLTGNELGTTVNTKLLSGLNSDPNNNTNFKIYYSSNPEATNDLKASDNAWKEDMELSEVKSFLIVPEDENYEMQKSDVIKFTYDFEIPENLEYNNQIYGTFATYYTNKSDVAEVNEISAPDLVYLTTGIGPQLEVETTVDCGDKVSENEELTIKSKVKNTGKVDLEDVKLVVPIPEGTTYSYAVFNEEKISAYIEDNNIVYEIAKVDKYAEEEVELKVMVNEIKSVDELEQSGDEFYNTITVTSSATAKNLNTPVKSKMIEIKVSVASLIVTVQKANGAPYLIKEGDLTSFNVAVVNTSDEEVKNVTAKVHVNKNFAIQDAFLVNKNDEKVDTLSNFDENTEVLECNIDKIGKSETRYIAINLRAKSLTDGITLERGEVYATAESSNVATVNSNSVEFKIGKPILTINQSTNTDTYVRTGNTIDYVFNIKNEGTYETGEFSLVDTIPEGLRVIETTSIQHGNVVTSQLSENREFTRNYSLLVGEEMVVNVKAVADSIESDEYTVSNKAILKSDVVGEIESNTVTHIVEDSITLARQELGLMSATSYSFDNSYTNDDGYVENKDNGSSIVKTYKITGNVWVDDNKNGMRDSGEKSKSAVKAILVNADTGIVVDTVTTDSTGAYVFNGIGNGNYLVVFEYDSSKYALTTFHKENVESNVNSDVISTEIEEDGEVFEGAVTEVITVENGSVSNIDMGLIVAQTFDLQLTKTISKITVQNSMGTSTYDYDNLTLAKAEIAAKNLATSTVYIEYTFIVENVGDVSGYAKSIVDYMPEGLTFNSSMNPDWYTGNDGNLYTTSLADKSIARGQKEEIKLILTKQMTEENTGVVNNTAEIAEAYNINGYEDINSTPGNKVESENDFGSADVLISVKTGEVFIYTSVIFTTLLLGGIAVFITVNKINEKRRKEGV